MQKIRPCLWFDTQAEEAAKFYTSIFPNSKIVEVTRYGSAGPRAEGTVMTVDVRARRRGVHRAERRPGLHLQRGDLARGRLRDAGGSRPYWDALTEGGEAGPCGWLKDRYGVSWQITPKVLYELIGDPDREKSQRVMAAMLKMGKIEIAELEQAAAAGLRTLEPGTAAHRPRLPRERVRPRSCPRATAGFSGTPAIQPSIAAAISAQFSATIIRCGRPCELEVVGLRVRLLVLRELLLRDRGRDRLVLVAPTISSGARSSS